MSRPGGEDLRRRMRQLEAQIEAFDRSAEPAAREAVREMLQTLLDFHGAGVARLVELLSEGGEPGRALLEACGQDGLAGSLLLLYGLHPVSLEKRVRQALDRLEPNLRTHGSEVELLTVSESVVRLRLQGGGDNRAGALPGLHATLEEAIRDAAPEVSTIEIDESVLVSLPLVDPTGPTRAIPVSTDDLV